jgi:exodeoxyribonuclease V alpha subunit
VVTTDPLDAGLVQGPAASGLLGTFNRAGVLAPADVHTAARLAAMAACPDDDAVDPDVAGAVALAVALAVRAPRMGHVSADLAHATELVAADADDDLDVGALPWPETAGWLRHVAASTLVTTEPAPPGERRAPRPLHLEGTSLYLDRHWRDELDVAAALRSLAGEAVPVAVVGGPAGNELGGNPGEGPDAHHLAGHDPRLLDAGLDRLFPSGADADQRRAAATVVTRRLTVIAGGPGTGKTTTVARLLALLHEQAVAAGERPPLVALAAPTGKAAARLEEAVRHEARSLDIDDEVRRRIAGPSGTTLHRLLGSRPGSTRFRHHRGHRLPHDVVVVDEASMVSLAMMARLLEAVRSDGRVVLVGDPQQLASVEAGAVLADIVAAAAPAGASSPARTPATPESVTSESGPPPAVPPGAAPPLQVCTALLRTTHRFGGALAELAEAVRAGDEDATVGVLGRGDPALHWVDTDVTADPDTVLDGVASWAAALVDAARSGDPARALAVLSTHRVLCAHRSGPAGVGAWNALVGRWVADARPDIVGEGAWYAGRPVMVNANDYAQRLFNGDVGVAVTTSGDGAGPGLPSNTGSGVVVAFDGGGGVRLVHPSRLATTETVHAMTVHKSQGSEFDAVTLLVPPARSRLLTRELLYTAVTRARLRLVLAGPEDAVRAAVRTPVARASGLTARLR